MQHSSYLALGAVIVVVGIGGAVLPAVVDAGNPIAYLRGAAHGRHSTTTVSDGRGQAPKHALSNEALPRGGDATQVPMVVPESGGAPAEAR